MKLRPLLLQVGVQVAMAGMRFVALGVMVAGSLLADGGGSASPPHRLALVDARGFGLAISTALFSQLFQHSVPGLIKPLRPAPTGRAVRGVFFAALGTTTALYLVLGSLGARAFGADTDAAVNINFVGLEWRASVVPRALQPVLNAVAIGFPAADTLSVFPLIAVTLGNSYDALGGGAAASQAANAGDARRARARAIAWRLAAAVPPIVATLAVADLALTLQLGGLCGVWVAFATPALLQRASWCACERAGAEPRVAFSWRFSSLEFTAGVLAFAAAASVVVAYQIADPART